MQEYKRLWDLRHDKHWTQGDIAKELSTTRQQYSLWERGDRESPFHKVIILAKLYNVSLDYIAGLIDEPHPIDPKKR